MTPQDLIFDTRVDTQKFIVSMKTKIVIRNSINKEGLCPLYLNATKNGDRARIFLDVHVSPSKWNKKTCRVRELDGHDTDINLILENVESKVTSIKTTFRLAEKQLDVKTFQEEFLYGIPRVNFHAFAKFYLEKLIKGQTIGKGTYKRYESILVKLEKFRPKLYFNSITISMVQDFRIWLSKKGNGKNTINSNIAGLKRFINAAQKQGIHIPIDIEEIKVGDTGGNRQTAF